MNNELNKIEFKIILYGQSYILYFHVLTYIDNIENVLSAWFTVHERRKCQILKYNLHVGIYMLIRTWLTKDSVGILKSCSMVLRVSL